MKLLIRSPSLPADLHLTIPYTPTTTVRDIKKAIKALSTLQPKVSQQHLLFAGRPLDNDDQSIQELFDSLSEEHQTHHYIPGVSRKEEEKTCGDEAVSDCGANTEKVHVLHLVLNSRFYEAMERKKAKGKERKVTVREVEAEQKDYRESEKEAAEAVSAELQESEQLRSSSSSGKGDIPLALPAQVIPPQGSPTWPFFGGFPVPLFQTPAVPTSPDPWRPEQIQEWHRQYFAYLQQYHHYCLTQQLAYLQYLSSASEGGISGDSAPSASTHSSSIAGLRRRKVDITGILEPNIPSEVQRQLRELHRSVADLQGSSGAGSFTAAAESEGLSFQERSAHLPLDGLRPVPHGSDNQARPPAVENANRPRMRLIVLPLNRLLSIFVTILKLLFFVYIFTRHADWYRAAFMYGVAMVVFLGEVGVWQVLRRRRRALRQIREAFERERRERISEDLSPVARATESAVASATGLTENQRSNPDNNGVGTGGLIPEIQAVFTSFFTSLIPGIARDDHNNNNNNGAAAADGMIADR